MAIDDRSGEPGGSGVKAGIRMDTFWHYALGTFAAIMAMVYAVMLAIENRAQNAPLHPTATNPAALHLNGVDRYVPTDWARWHSAAVAGDLVLGALCIATLFAVRIIKGRIKKRLK